jgi:hypothetical protein
MSEYEIIRGELTLLVTPSTLVPWYLPEAALEYCLLLYKPNAV